MEFLFITDNHLGRLKSYLPDLDWLNYSFQALHQAEKYALDNGIENIVHGGDWFDYMPTQDLLIASSKFFSKSQVKWWLIGGNHAVVSATTHGLQKLISEAEEHKWLDKVQFFVTPEKVKIEGISFLMMPWPYIDHDILNTKRSIVIAHEERAGFRLDNGREIKGNAFDLKGHFWFIGHLHTYQKAKDIVAGGACMQLRNGDAPEKYFLHVTVNKKIKPSIKKVVVQNPYEFVDITIDTADDISKVALLQPHQYARLLVNVQVALPDEVIHHSQVIDTKPYGNKQDLQAIKERSINIEHVAVSTRSRIRMIKEYLKNSKLTPELQKRAIKRVKKDMKRMETKTTGLL